MNIAITAGWPGAWCADPDLRARGRRARRTDGRALCRGRHTRHQRRRPHAGTLLHFFTCRSFIYNFGYCTVYLLIISVTSEEVNTVLSVV